MHNESLLQIQITVEEYLKVCHDAEAKRWPAKHFPEYWTMMPRYTLSRCPFCEITYSEKVDTYSLRNWMPDALQGFEAYSESAEPRHCSHFVAAQVFINLNGHHPDFSSPHEIRRMSIHLPAEAPMLMKFLFDAPSNIKAVMHSLPICKIEGDTFSPKYTLYVICYFADSAISAHQGRLTMGSYRADIRRDTLLAWPFQSGDHPDWFDLDASVLRGELGWLALDDCESELIFQNGDDFPYAGISGRRYPFWDIVTEKSQRGEE